MIYQQVMIIIAIFRRKECREMITTEKSYLKICTLIHRIHGCFTLWSFQKCIKPVWEYWSKEGRNPEGQDPDTPQNSTAIRKSSGAKHPCEKSTSAALTVLPGLLPYVFSKPRGYTLLMNTVTNILAVSGTKSPPIKGWDWSEFWVPGLLNGPICDLTL